MNQDIELGIVDIRKIISEINRLYHYDFKDYALTSFRRRIENFMNTHNFKDVDYFISRLNEDRKFFDTLLEKISVGNTEMFRDPSLWRLVKEEILPALWKNSTHVKIWIPNNVSGDELFTLLIIIRESGLDDNYEIIASSICDKHIEEIQSGYFNPRKLQISNDNYSRFNSTNEFFDYYTLKDNIPYRDISLLKNVKFNKQNIIFDETPDMLNLVIYRNQMIYLNQTLQDRVTKKIHDCLRNNGFLIIGDKENIPTYFKGFVNVSKTEKIFKKKNI